MPKNKGKGGKTRRRGASNREETKRELVFKEHGQEYAIVEKMLGDGRLMAYCYDHKRRMCIIRGAMRKRVWIGVGDTILIGIREFQDDKADVISKYNADEVRSLKCYGELPKLKGMRSGVEDQDAMEEDEDCAFDFDNI